MKIHGNTKHAKSFTKLYRVYAGMKQRCVDRNKKDWKKYGGRGITVCEEWRNNFQIFYDWSMANGYKHGLQIDRINGSLGYSPNNCRWVTPKENSINRNSTIWVYGMCLWDYCHKHNKVYSTVITRLKKGLNINEALNQEKYKRMGVLRNGERDKTTVL